MQVLRPPCFLVCWLSGIYLAPYIIRGKGAIVIVVTIDEVGIA
jgi:hypothetical protein